MHSCAGSRLKQLQRFSQGTDCQDFHPRNGLFGHIALGNDRFAKAMLDRLLQALLARERQGAEGGTLLQHARQVLAALGDLADELSARRERASGVVRLAVSPAKVGDV